MLRFGQIITLGNHRLMCGDATNPEHLRALIGTDKVDLVLTDPPYGNRIQNARGVIGPVHERITNLRVEVTLKPQKHKIMQGNQDTSAARKFYLNSKPLCKHMIIWGGAYFSDFLPSNGGWIFWHKHTGNSDFSDGEMAWRSWGRKVWYFSQTWNGCCMQGNFALNGRVANVKGARSRLHPTQKPVELHMRLLETFSYPGDVVLDGFGGSGTTLIAAEMTHRRCLMMELDPEYCSVIIDRYKAVRSMC